MSETTLRDTIESAIEEHSQEAVTPEITQETQEQQAERLRDEKGRFAAKEQEQEQAAQAVATPTQIKPRPSSWKKDYEEHWSKLDPSVQEYIMQREADYAKGVSTYKSQWDQAAPFLEAMQPFMPLLQEHNIQPHQWIQNLGNAHRVLAMGSPEEKLQTFARLANDYGIPLESLTGGQQANPQFSMLAQELNTLKNELGQYRTTFERQQQDKLQQEIQEFAASAPHFDALRDSMAQILESGFASTLKDAYDKAMRLNDEIWQQQQAEQAKSAETERVKQAQAAKAKAVSTKSATPTGMETTGSGKKGLRELIAEQVESAAASRV